MPSSFNEVVTKTSRACAVDGGARAQLCCVQSGGKGAAPILLPAARCGNSLKISGVCLFVFYLETSFEPSTTRAKGVWQRREGETENCGSSLGSSKLFLFLIWGMSF